MPILMLVNGKLDAINGNLDDRIKEEDCSYERNIAVFKGILLFLFSKWNIAVFVQ